MNTSSANIPESRPVLLEELQPFNSQTAQTNRKPPRRETEVEPLLTADDVAKRLNVSTDWDWDHSSRKKPFLPVIRMGDGTLRYRRGAVGAFIGERERISAMRRRAG